MSFVEPHRPLPRPVEGDATDRALVDAGIRRIEWAAREMPVLALIRARFRRERPLRGIRIAGCLHITAETAILLSALQDGGAEVTTCASNPLSTQDDVAIALNLAYGIATHALRGEDNATYYGHINACLDSRPQVTMDDGCDLVATIHTKRRELLPEILGGTEETTTGVIRLHGMARAGALAFPIIAVNDADTKHLFDNRYGTGQSTLDGILRATNLLLAGKIMVVAGYGWCGRGVATRARGMGAQVIVTEVDPVPALEAVMDGFRVLPMTQAAAEGDVFVTATGDINVVDRRHLEAMKDGAILANAGHFDDEINLHALASLSEGQRPVREFVQEYRLIDGRSLFLLGEGRVINLAAAEGHPASVMDVSFANQALSVEHVVQHVGSLAPGVYPVPRAIDQEIARLKLHAMGVSIDTLSEEQRTYLSSWQSGT